MGRYIVKRLLYIILVFFILSFMIYMIYNMLPIDKAVQSSVFINMQLMAIMPMVISVTRHLSDSFLIFNSRRTLRDDIPLLCGLLWDHSPAPRGAFS